MTQLIVSVEETSLLSDIRKAIKLLRGVASVSVGHEVDVPNPTTLKAMHEAETGQTIVCDTMEDYLKLVSDELQD